MMQREQVPTAARRRRPARRLRHAFSAFLRRRRRLHHFGQPGVADPWAQHGPPAQALADELQQAACDEADAALARLNSQAQGLSMREARARLTRFGPNEVGHEPPLPAWLHLWDCYRNPFNLLLTALALLSLLNRDLRAAVVIGSMVALSTAIRFAQERRSHHAAERLRALVSNTATVLRQDPGAASGSSPVPRDVPLRSIVPGDIVLLSAGDMVPADGRVLWACDLFVAQAAMTGESQPVEKLATAAPAGADSPLARRNLVFMGTNVVSGSARMLAVATGSRSHFGRLASQVTATDREPDAFQTGVNAVSWLLIRFAAVMVPVVLLINGFTKGDWLQAGLFALSIAVGLTPEMLPMIVTTTLAKGAVLLSRRKVVVKRLDAIHDFGAMDVLCTDKTGTLTQDRIALAQHVDAWGAPSEAVLRLAFLNSHYQTGLKNLLDRAVLDHVQMAEEMKLAEDYRKVDEIPFDFQRRRMSVVVAERDDHHALICKGAVEEVLAACTAVQRGSQALPLDVRLQAQVRQAAAALNASGLRTVAVAMKMLPAMQCHYAPADEAGLTLVGFIGFLDPPKDSAAPALRALAAHGIQVKVLTGDNDIVARHVCGQVGLDGQALLLGAQVEEMDDAALGLAVRQHQVFARLTPLQKERIVRALRAQGHVVGFMGDGINDAPALRAADIGISVDTAVDIAKEAADIILLEKSLMVLDEGVMEGRSTFCNMLKYIRMTASSNFGNVLSVLVASAFLPFLPMLPLQLLVQNLLSDIAQTGIPFDRTDAELVASPLAWHPADIGRFMLCFGPVSSLFDLATFALMWFAFHADSVAKQSLFQSGWFVVGLLTQTLVVHLIRTCQVPFLQSRASPPLMLSTFGVMLLGLWLPMGPLAPALGLQPLPGPYFGWLAAILLGYAWLISLVKRAYLRRFGWH